MSTHQSKMESQIQLANRKHDLHLSSYPIDLPSFLSLTHYTLVRSGVPCQVNPPVYHPTTITHYALAHWNRYLATNDERHRSAFLAQACWLVQHEVRIGEDVAGWPHRGPVPERPTSGSWLSAVTQGCALSVLTRAFVLTEDATFLELADRVVRTFERDILDGGVSAPVGTDGVFFEAVAVYPAAHQLSGFLLAVLGLYDYLALRGESRIEHLLLLRAGV